MSGRGWEGGRQNINCSANLRVHTDPKNVDYKNLGETLSWANGGLQGRLDWVSP